MAKSDCRLDNERAKLKISTIDKERPIDDAESVKSQPEEEGKK